jgi:NADPH:quinone reductase-like Zn-dependent oxidoreductase
LSGAQVTAVDSAAKLDMLRAIGADHVIDYARDDFTRSGGVYDVIVDVVGKSSFSRSLRSLPKGVISWSIRGCQRGCARAGRPRAASKSSVDPVARKRKTYST